MTDASPRVRLRYPLSALLLVGASWLLYAVVLLVSAILILPCVPLAPALVILMISLGGLLSSAHEYARSVATPVRKARLVPLGQTQTISRTATRGTA
jgi:hypothetical protein